jgi:hypothetical protein
LSPFAPSKAALVVPVLPPQGPSPQETLLLRSKRRQWNHRPSFVARHSLCVASLFPISYPLFPHCHVHKTTSPIAGPISEPGNRCRAEKLRFGILPEPARRRLSESVPPAGRDLCATVPLGKWNRLRISRYGCPRGESEKAVRQKLRSKTPVIYGEKAIRARSREEEHGKHL